MNPELAEMIAMLNVVLRAHMMTEPTKKYVDELLAVVRRHMDANGTDAGRIQTLAAVAAVLAAVVEMHPESKHLALNAVTLSAHDLVCPVQHGDNLAHAAAQASSTNGGAS